MTTLGDLAGLVGGEVLGDPALEICGASTLRWAEAGQIALFESTKYLRELASSRASALLVPRTCERERLHLPLIVVDDSVAAFTVVVRHFRPAANSTYAGFSGAALVHPEAQIDASATIYPGAWIDARVRVGARAVIHSGCRLLAGTVIGEDSVLFPNVVCYENTQIGRRVIIHANAVLGAYGFGYGFQDGRHTLSAQVGNVEVHDDVEIGAGTTIDRGTYAATVIGEGTKIDNLVQIAHNCRIGRHNLLCSQVGIAGSCVTGDYVVMAGQVGVRDHVDIGDGVRLGAKAGVSSDVPANQSYFGVPARPEKDERTIMIATARIPAMRKQLREMQRLVNKMASKLGLHQGSNSEAELDTDCRSDAA